MSAHDRPAPGRTGLPLPRRAEPGRVPAARTAPEVPEVPELHALLRDLDALRTSLTADLSVAAAALDAGEHELAGQVVTGDLADVRAFERRALGHLAALAAAPPAAREADPPGELAGAQRARLPRRWRLAAAPLLAGAAALLGVLAVPAPAPPPVDPAPVAMTSAADASRELNRLARAGAPAEDLRVVAEVLNDRLAVLVSAARTDPAAAREALVLLRDTREVLRRAGDDEALGGVLAEIQELAARLTSLLPRTAAAVQPPDAPSAAQAPARTARDARPGAAPRQAPAAPSAASADAPATPRRARAAEEPPPRGSRPAPAGQRGSSSPPPAQSPSAPASGPVLPAARVLTGR